MSALDAALFAQTIFGILRFISTLLLLAGPVV